MSSVTPAAGPIHLGMDTSKNTIVAGILMPGDEVPVIGRIWDEEGPGAPSGQPAGRPGGAAGLLRGRAVRV